MPSKAYHRALAESQAHQANAKTYSGKFLRPHKPWLLGLIADLGIASALDYGCGKGEQYTWTDPTDGRTLEQSFGFEVAKYDPAWPPFAAEPTGRHDLVICTHVLGSIPMADLPWALERLYSLAGKAVFIAEKIGAPKKKVFSKPYEHPFGWSDAAWKAAIQAEANRHPGILTFASFRHIVNGGSVVQRWRWIGAYENQGHWMEQPA